MNNASPSMNQNKRVLWMVSVFDRDSPVLVESYFRKSAADKLAQKWNDCPNLRFRAEVKRVEVAA
jgi:hypothetical protein